MPETEWTWVRDTGGSQEMITDWSQALLGIQWPPGNELAPANCFVIGRAESNAWIADVRPGKDGELNVFLGWDENALDPLGCALLPTAAKGGLPILRRHIRLADLPAPDTPTAQQLATYKQSWKDHLLVVNLPRGPRGSEWGVALIAADGRVLDEWPVAPRVESIHLKIGIIGSSGPLSSCWSRAALPSGARWWTPSKAPASEHEGAAPPRRAHASAVRLRSPPHGDPARGRRQEPALEQMVRRRDPRR